MAKCGKKVKNACKMCLQPVTQKTGLQCQGACLSWVHYSCLNYTPGRIKDIKNGIIKVTCPCPDCKTKFPKEYRTDEAFSCTNEQCPANRPPKCENIACPSNTVPPPPPPGYPMPPLSQCGLECQKYGPRGQTPTADAKTNVQFTNRGASSGYPSPCASSGDVPGNMNRGGGGFPCLEAVEQMCNTVGQLTTQINDLMNKMVQAMQAQGGLQAGGGGGQAGGGCCPAKHTGCTQSGPRSKCPMPCHCPGNPAKRK